MKRISLTQGKVAIVDDADYKALSKYKWCAVKTSGRYYAVRNEKKPGESRKYALSYMHRELVKAKPYRKVYHKSNNTLDNRRKNLIYPNPKRR